MLLCTKYKECPEFIRSDEDACPHKVPHEDDDDENCERMACCSDWGKGKEIYCVSEFVIFMKEALYDTCGK